MYLLICSINIEPNIVLSARHKGENTKALSSMNIILNGETIVVIKHFNIIGYLL